MPDSYQGELPSFNTMYSLWSILCNVNSNDHVVQPFSGFGVHDRLKNGVQEERKKTKLTYFPPTNVSITDFDTIYKLFEMLLLQAGKVNVPYVNLTLDAGAYVNEYRVLCNYPDKFSKIVLHLGHFNSMKELFTMLGTLMKGSGFEDVIFQAGVYSTRSLNEVLSGSHYNRCWTVLSVKGEALERLRMKLFMNNSNVLANEVRMCYEDIPISSEFLAEGDAVITFMESMKNSKPIFAMASKERQQNSGLFIT